MIPSMETQSTYQPVPDDEIDLRELFLKLWRGKWLIVGVTFVCSAIAVTYALLAEPVFRSEALVQVRDDSKAGGGLGALASQFGGLADFAGVSLGGGGKDRAVVLATLQSRVLIQQFILDENLMPKLFPAHWNEAEKNWRVSDPKKIPTLMDAYTVFKKSLLRVGDDKKTGLITIAIEWRDPKEAAQWITSLISRTNAFLRNKAISEGERNLSYLQQQAKEASVVTVQQSMFGLIEVEIKKLMVAKGGDEYALKTIDPAQAPTKRIRPRRAQISVIGALLGGFLGIVLVLILNAFRATPPRNSLLPLGAGGRRAG